MQAARSSIRLLLATLFTAQLGALAKTKADDKFFWYNYTVDSLAGESLGTGHGAVPGNSSLKCDTAGNLKLAYRGHYDIKFAELNNYHWKTEQADTGTGSDAKMDMALDGAGNPHIIYHDWSYNYVYYAHKADDKWSHLLVKKLALPNVDFYQVSITADKDGNAHMAFTSKGSLGYANTTYAKVDKDGNLAAPYFINDGGINGKWNSLTLDSEGKPVVAYYVFENSNLGVAVKSGDTSFATQIVDSGGFENAHGYYASIQRENDTSYYVSYVNEAKKVIQLAHGKPGGTWTVEKIDTMPQWTLFSSPVRLALDSKGSPVLAYPVVTPLDGSTAAASFLRIAYKASGSWVYQTVDSLGVAGEYVSLTMLPNDMPAVSYWERSKNQLKVAVGSLTAPPDADNNGIPDYQEVAGVLRNPRQLRYRPANFTLFDPLGRYQGLLRFQQLPAGAYYGSEGDRILLR